jgi:myosin protein heavy chain
MRGSLRVTDILRVSSRDEAFGCHTIMRRLTYRVPSLFLISINPYKDLGLYTPQIVAAYRKKRRDEAVPHIFATAERAWVQMGEERECQSILIT